MPDNNLATVCGLDCGDCEHLGTRCEGCANEKGRPFWTSVIGIDICPLYDCCINKKKLEHCGLCPELPCEIFLTLKDPALSEEEFDQSLQERQDALKRRMQVESEK